MGERESQSKSKAWKAESKALQSLSWVIGRFPVNLECDHGFTELSKALQSPEAEMLNYLLTPGSSTFIHVLCADCTSKILRIIQYLQRRCTQQSLCCFMAGSLRPPIHAIHGRRAAVPAVKGGDKPLNPVRDVSMLPVCRESQSAPHHHQLETSAPWPIVQSDRAMTRCVTDEV